jgi:predicted enzyme related to lactoylglutathione lyase
LARKKQAIGRKKQMNQTEIQTMPSVTGVLETALYVEDLPAAMQFYRMLFHFDTLFLTSVPAR